MKKTIFISYLTLLLVVLTSSYVFGQPISIFPVPENGGASVTVLTPNGGENWIKGTKNVITWRYSLPSQPTSKSLLYFNIYLEGKVNGVIGTMPVSIYSLRPEGVTGRFVWDTKTVVKEGEKVEVVEDSNYKVRITLESIPACMSRICPLSAGVVYAEDRSDNPFSIVSSKPEEKKAYLRVVSPNGGEQWELGKTYLVSWEFVGLPRMLPLNIGPEPVLSLNIDLYRRVMCINPPCEPQFVKNLAKGVNPIRKSWPWKVDAELGNNYLIKVSIPDLNLEDYSDDVFSVVQPGGEADLEKVIRLLEEALRILKELLKR